MKRLALVAVAATALVGAASAAAGKPLCVGTDGGCFPTLGAALAAVAAPASSSWGRTSSAPASPRTSST